MQTRFVWPSLYLLRLKKFERKEQRYSGWVGEHQRRSRRGVGTSLARPTEPKSAPRIKRFLSLQTEGKASEKIDQAFYKLKKRGAPISPRARADRERKFIRER